MVCDVQVLSAAPLFALFRMQSLHRGKVYIFNFRIVFFLWFFFSLHQPPTIRALSAFSRSCVCATFAPHAHKRARAAKSENCTRFEFPANLKLFYSISFCIYFTLFTWCFFASAVDSHLIRLFRCCTSDV